MKEAIGSTLLFKLIFAFIVIYMGIMAIGINYAITFRVKNQIVSLLEQFEGYENAKEPISNYLDTVGYYGGGATRKEATTKETPTKDYSNGNKVGTSGSCQNTQGGYCIQEYTTDRGVYYKVTTYMYFDFPIIGKFIQAPVTGESSVIYNLDNV